MGLGKYDFEQYLHSPAADTSVTGSTNGLQLKKKMQIIRIETGVKEKLYKLSPEKADGKWSSNV